MQDEFASRARALVGTRFRPQGRTVETGIDCIGFALATYGIDSTAVRRNYRLRGDHRAEVERELARFFSRIPMPQRRSGDLMLLAVSSEQVHLAVWTGAGFVHADAGIGRVVETHGEPRWGLVGAFRRRARPHPDR